MDAFEFGHQARRLRMGTLVRLRWIAAGGQLATILFAQFVLHIGFAFAAATACALALLAFNMFLWLRYSPAMRLEEKTTTLILAVDILQLAIMLYLTGGLGNPFAVLLITPTMISAVSQSWRETGKLLALAIVSAAVLTEWNLPLRFGGDTLFDPPAIEKVGALAAIVISAVFVTVYGGQVAKEARQLAQALAATELILTRAEHLSQLDGLAAAAAHELGTPLATLTVVVHELSADGRIAALCAEDLDLAAQELKRCRAILGQLSRPDRVGSEPFDRVGLEALLEEVAGPHRLQDIDIVITVKGPEPRPACARNPALLYGLRNLVSNAVTFASERVAIDAAWTRDRIEVSIADDGPGFSQTTIQRLGEPYISDRRVARRSDEGGLGLGLFIAKALLERTGAELRIGNLRAPERGACAVVSWPRRLFGSETQITLTDAKAEAAT